MQQTKFSLKDHISSLHEGKKPFKCDICGSSFSRKHYLKVHIAYHEKKNAKLKAKEDINGPN